VILACHSDEALALLGDATPQERQILGDLPYQANEVLLHTDTSVLPRRHKAWASWNFLLDQDEGARPQVTYQMNLLQGLEAPETFCVTLNPRGLVAEEKILRRFVYHHPVFNPKSLAAQKQRAEICGVDRTHFCGAYWYSGFHEDGVHSATDVAERFGCRL